MLKATTPRVAAVLAVTAVVLCLAEGLRSAAFLRRVTQELILMRHKVSGVSAFTAAALVLLLRVMDLPVVTVVLALTLPPPALEAVTEVMVAAEGWAVACLAEEVVLAEEEEELHHPLPEAAAEASPI